MRPSNNEITTMVLVRHGETEWNRVERFRGRTDIELNETGHTQAQAVAGRLATWPVQAVFSSPLKRALDTARPIAAACGHELSILESVIDVDYGDWAGLSPEEAQARDPDVFTTWRDNPLLARFPHGERMEQVRDRTWGAIEGLCATHPGQTLVLVSHVAILRTIFCAALGLEGDGFWRIGHDNAAISVLEAGAGRRFLRRLNDTCHLEEVAQQGWKRGGEKEAPW
jgi:broad specificity phosphatase PhoE